jgi:phosphoglycolate phosphatase-like HAD superfamily hydrolase
MTSFRESEMGYIEQIELIVCDLDGTLCDVKHRQHLAQAGQWEEFHRLLEKDEPRAMVLAFLQMVTDLSVSGMPGPAIIFLTGRPGNYRGETVKWLTEKCGLAEDDDYRELLMRPVGDFSSDTVFKEQALKDYLETNVIDQRTVLILDDREKVVAHLRDLDYDVWQVQEGAF